MRRQLPAILLFVLVSCSRQFDAPAKTPERSLAVTLRSTLRVSDVRDADRRVRAEVALLGGFVLDSASLGDDDVSFELRVPLDRLAELRTSLAALGEVQRESERTEDVTEQRADLGARLRNAQVQEQRLRSLAR